MASCGTSSGVVTMTQPYQSYSSSRCQSGDWAYMSGKCSKLNPNVCTANKVGPVGPTSWSWADPSSNGPEVKCSGYDTCLLTTYDRSLMEEWTAKFGKNESWRKDIMPRWCSQQVDNVCPIDPMTGKQSTQCSRLISSGEDGRYCRAWANDNSREADKAMKEYCLAHNTAECGCINRNKYKEFNDVKGDYPFSDGCWWQPCKNNTSYLVPSDLYDPRCPENICQQLIKQMDSKDINFKENQFVINCSSSGKTSALSVSKKLLYIISGTLLVIVFIIALLASVYFISKKKNSVPKGHTVTMMKEHIVDAAIKMQDTIPQIQMSL